MSTKMIAQSIFFDERIQKVMTTRCLPCSQIQYGAGWERRSSSSVRAYQLDR